jgi:hypothetical protein
VDYVYAVGNIRQTKAKDITPTAWKKPELIKNRLFTSPRDSEGTRNPWVITATTITNILMSAKADALASYYIVSLGNVRPLHREIRIAPWQCPGTEIMGMRLPGQKEQ